MLNDDFYMGHTEKIALFSEKWTSQAEAFLLKEKCENAKFSGTFGDLSFLPSCGHSLRRIKLSNYSEKIGHLTELKDLENLFVNFKSKDNALFTDLPNLRVLQFKWGHHEQGVSALTHPNIWEMRVDNMPEIEECPSNKSLEILVMQRFKAKNFDCFKGFSKLAAVNMIRSGLESLHGLPPSMHFISINGSRKLGDLDHLADMPSLKVLHLVNSYSGKALPDALYACSSLKRIGFMGMPYDADWSKILKMPNVDDLCIVETPTGVEEAVIQNLCKTYNRKLIRFQQVKTKRHSITSVKLEAPPGCIHSDKILHYAR